MYYKLLKFISLLGTSSYIPCNYFLKGRENLIVKDCCYVQKAILDILRQENILPDEIIIFTTSEAYESNWKDLNKNKKENHVHENKEERQERPGLRDELIKYKETTSVDFRNVNIPNGSKEEDLWVIFNAILDELNENDEVIFDITHSFRYLPMLVFVVINYARVVKKCKLNSIYYGAFEVLGDKKQAPKIPLQERNAPIFELTSFVDLFDWTIGIDRYLNTGDVSVVHDLARTEIKKINNECAAIKESEGEKTDSKILFMDSNQLRALTNAMKKFSDVVFTCRGLELTPAIRDLKDNLEKVMDSASKQRIEPLVPVFKMIKERFDRFSSDKDHVNIIETARWCADNKMYQQGLTILHEGLISYACDLLGYTDKEQKKELKNRDKISSYAFVVSDHFGRKGNKKENIHLLDIKPDAVTDLFLLLGKMGDIRNDINHAGWRKDPSSDKVLKNKLNEFIPWAEKIILSSPIAAGYSCNNDEIRDKKMLLIFSHELTPKQKEEARQRFGVSKFLSMPNELYAKWSSVPASKGDLHSYLGDILKWIELNADDGDYALVQGEYGATYMTVSHCLSKGIIPVYSTTQRIVKEDKVGEKVIAQREFEHVIFREYET